MEHSNKWYLDTEIFCSKLDRFIIYKHKNENEICIVQEEEFLDFMDMTKQRGYILSFRTNKNNELQVGCRISSEDTPEVIHQRNIMVQFPDEYTFV